jgi:branched-chain amino acid aminotransferase
MEAKLEGYAEGIALNTRGHVSEGSGENIFLVQDGRLVTPPLSSAILPGITRDCVMTLAREMGLAVAEDTVPREMLYVADEVFMTGSAAEITPVRSVDRILIGSGKRGPVTKRLQEAFFDVVEGRRPDGHRWLTYVVGD